MGILHKEQKKKYFQMSLTGILNYSVLQFDRLTSGFMRILLLHKISLNPNSCQMHLPLNSSISLKTKCLGLDNLSFSHF